MIKGRTKEQESWIKTLHGNSVVSLMKENIMLHTNYGFLLGTFQDIHFRKMASNVGYLGEKPHHSKSLHQSSFR